MGTGAMSIKSTANGTGLSRGMLFDTTEDDDIESDEEGEGLDSAEQQNPVFAKFLREGPLNLMAHERYNVKTGLVDPDPRELRKEQRRLRLTAANMEQFDHEGDVEQESLGQGQESLEHEEQGVAQSVLSAWQGSSEPANSAFPLTLLTNLPPLTGKQGGYSPGGDSEYSSYTSNRSSPDRNRNRSCDLRSRSPHSRTHTRSRGSQGGRRSGQRKRQQKDGGASGESQCLLRCGAMMGYSLLYVLCDVHNSLDIVLLCSVHQCSLCCPRARGQGGDSTRAGAAAATGPRSHGESSRTA